MAVPVSGAIIRASDWTTVFPTNTDAWPTYTPTLTQGVAVTFTTEYCGYMKIGRLAIVDMSLSVTSAGTAANAVAVGFPAAVGGIAGYRVVGIGGIYDASVNTWYPGPAYYASATTFNIGASSGNGGPLGVTAFTAALASGDKVSAILHLMTTS